MKENLKKLREAVTEWLIRNDLDTDTQFCEIEDWRSCNNEYLNDAVLILYIETGFDSFHEGGYDEFENLVESFGFWFERGDASNLGFYPLDDYDFSLLNKTYVEKLKDYRWLKKREIIKERAGFTCEDCGNSKGPLDVHHCYYVYECEPWEYPNDVLRCLCRSCHVNRAKAERRMRAFLASLNWQEMDKIRNGLKDALYWLDRGAIFAHLESLGPYDEKILSSIDRLLKTRIVDPNET
jgi:hypothetical protein